MKRLIYLLGAALLASPAAPTGCETVNVWATYQGRYGTYTVTRAVTGEGKGRWDVLIGLDGKQIIPLEK